jgi:hypothetical protein
MKSVLLIAAAVFAVYMGSTHAAGPSAPLTVTVTSSSALPGSILPPCPGGCTWSLGFDDEFNGEGSPGNLSTDGINWNTWTIYRGEGLDSWSMEPNGPGTSLLDCTDSAFESGGYLHILPIGSVGVYWSTASNPAKNCELDYNNAGPGYWEAYVNYDNADGWADADWLCCSTENGVPGVEADVLEVNKATLFWNDYANNQVVWQGSGLLAGWHEIGIDWEAEGGYTFYIDGTNLGGLNPMGCSASTPCNSPQVVRIMNGNTGGGPGNNPTGMLVDWIRQYTHP